MKSIFTLLMCLLFFPLNSQPTLTALNEASTGNTFIFELADTTGISPGPGGVLQTWDFSSVATLGMQQTESWVDPATTPFQSLYPTATIAQTTDNGLGTFNYTYFTQSVNQTEVNGIVITSAAVPVDMHYSNTQILRQYPATYTNTLQDNYEGMSFLTIGPITANTYRTGSYEYLVDGYGTLITPAGNFPNTLRIKLRHVFTDSIVYTGVPMPTDIIQSFSTTYFWASTDAGDKLYQFFIGYDTTITDAVISTFKTVNFQKITTGIAENIPNDVPAALIYPNPATEFATLRITNPVSGLATLDLYNNNGQLVKSASVSMINNNFFEWRISLTDFAPGLYTVKISCKSQSWMTRILKQ